MQWLLLTELWWWCLATTWASQEQPLHDSDAAALAQEQVLLDSVDWQT